MVILDQPRPIGGVAIIFAMGAISIYLLMVTVTLAHLQEVSGSVPFDMRPFGYGPTDARILLDALGAEGRTYYLKRQIPLDSLYPALLALTLMTAICWIGRRHPKSKLIRIGIIFALGGAVFDYAENLGIMVMILNWPNLSDPLVYGASTATVVKSALTTFAVLLLIAVTVLEARRSMAGTAKRQTVKQGENV
ncbi:MAG: hypothetical protein ABJO27_04115 [Pseudoruegeria sp.]